MAGPCDLLHLNNRPTRSLHTVLRLMGRSTILWDVRGWTQAAGCRDSIPPAVQSDDEGRMMPDAAPLHVVRGACGHDCPDTCSWVVEVRNGTAERLAGDPGHPFTRGTLCAKVNHYLERVYHPDRVLHPLKRSGPKGDARFVRVSWEEALADISSRWHAIAAESGAEAILPY